MKTVVDTTANNGFCCGCGVCAGICPKNALKMDWNTCGEYNPIIETKACIACGLCTSVCPFVDTNDTETNLANVLYSKTPDIHHCNKTGYYISYGAGYVSNEEHRLHSVSGGLATWFLSKLLEDDVVDAVLCVHHTTNNDKLFQFTIAHTPKEIYDSAGSAYYPVEISEMLQYVLHNPGHYAVIGLPCLLKSLRLAQKKSKVLSERLTVFVGLACANQKSTLFAQYAAWKAGIRKPLTHIDFRRKNPEQRLAKFFTFTFQDSEGNTLYQHWDAELSSMYSDKCFTLHSCDCCDDTFAECADISFMDAWLPKYIMEPKGTSVYISRSVLAEKIIQDGISSKEIIIGPVNLNEILLGQSAVRWKQEILGYRLHLLKESGENPPRKRILPNDGTCLSYLEREKCKRAIKMQHEGRLIFSETHSWSNIHEWFINEFSNTPMKTKILSKMSKGIHLSKTGLKYLLHK